MRGASSLVGGIVENIDEINAGSSTWIILHLVDKQKPKSVPIDNLKCTSTLYPKHANVGKLKISLIIYFFMFLPIVVPYWAVVKKPLDSTRAPTQSRIGPSSYGIALSGHRLHMCVLARPHHRFHPRHLTKL